jgi:hypothetical protein
LATWPRATRLAKKKSSKLPPGASSDIESSRPSGIADLRAARTLEEALYLELKAAIAVDAIRSSGGNPDKLQWF